MFRLLLVAVLLFWAVMTSGVTVGDVARAAVDWASTHVEVSAR